jgi:hypothetical protein
MKYLLIPLALFLGLGFGLLSSAFLVDAEFGDTPMPYANPIQASTLTNAPGNGGACGS